MRAVYFDEGKVELREIQELPDKGKKVHVRSTGICGSDLHLLEMKYPLPFIAGHEFAGVLDDGTPVAVEPVVPCEACEYCSTGEYNLCPSVATLGVSRNGGMADEVIVPERCLVYLPSNVDVKDACLIEPLAVAVHGIRKAGVNGKKRVAVIGGGTIGLCAVAAAGSSCTAVGLAARYSHQKEAGDLLGAKEIEGQYDIVVECAGTESAVNQAVSLCRPGGKILMIATYWAGLSFPQFEVMMKELTIVNSYTYATSGAGRDYDIAASLLSRNPKIASALITHRFPLEEVTQAFSVARDRKSGAIKVVLEP
ncbi:MAG: alcohol dehydrogenase catalytic domain-containing protein [Deltaproteobacteria bacterium]|nr:alcohol dehydrogenase catalytic domain-containing protein [Deltaproteobacteria bacterium]